ncbi:MAG: hypothetical protein JWQ96_3464 [Segetibacter sp.]|nr:hypothetical protein [Segetibacter sp.]
METKAAYNFAVQVSDTTMLNRIRMLIKNVHRITSKKQTNFFKKCIWTFTNNWFEGKSIVEQVHNRGD